MKELLKDTDFNTLPKDHQDNLTKLLEALNKLRAAYGKPMRVSSGYRSLADHLRIYKEKGITDQSKIPMKSNHLFGLACDFSDADGKLKEWVNNNLQTVIDIGLYMEDFAHTKTWLHVQIKPYGNWKPGKSPFFVP